MQNEWLELEVDFPLSETFSAGFGPGYKQGRAGGGGGPDEATLAALLWLITHCKKRKKPKQLKLPKPRRHRINLPWVLRTLNSLTALQTAKLYQQYSGVLAK